MDIKPYFDQFVKKHKNLELLSLRSGLSVMYLRHIANRHKNPNIDTTLKLLEGCDAEIALDSIRPDIFPKTKAGRRGLRLLKKSIELSLK